MKRVTYQAIAIGGLVPVAYGTYELGAPVARLLSEIAPSLSGLLALLGYLLTLLGLVVVWGLLLLPLRSRAGFGPVLGDLDTLSADGFRTALIDEQKRLDDAKRSDDPAVRVRYHLTFAGISVLLGIAGAALTYALYLDDHLLATPLAFALVTPFLVAYHGVHAVRFFLRR